VLCLCGEPDVAAVVLASFAIECLAALGRPLPLLLGVHVLALVWHQE
jgi:hypothetical protein